MTTPVHLAFENEVVSLRLTQVLPQRTIVDSVKATTKYKRIARSIEEIGLVEPLVVYRLPKRGAGYLLVDGHLRLSALLELGQTAALCLIADDDEAFTYNKRVSRLATIQEHFMIVRALKRGVSETKLAKALNIDTKSIQRRASLLDRICPEVVDLLKDRQISPHTFDVLRKMKPLRQIEASELMAIAGNFTSTYAKALLAATRQQDLVKADEPKRVIGLSPEQMARMEREMASVQEGFRQIEASYGDDVLHLVIATGYLAKLLQNKEIERYLARHHDEILQEFRKIVATGSLDQAVAIAA